MLRLLFSSFLMIASVIAPVKVYAEMKTFQNAHDFSFPSIEGGQIDLSAFAGQTVLVVNTASECGFTGQYDGLQHIWETYRDRGLVVLAVPSNDFGGQETGSNSEIKTFCDVNFNVNFPMTEKQIVKGDNAHPFFNWVIGELGASARPRWNFYKYLIGPDGDVVDWFSSMTRPDSRKFIRAVEATLPQNQAAS